jgi:hypothetical protein
VFPAIGSLGTRRVLVSGVVALVTNAPRFLAARLPHALCKDCGNVDKSLIRRVAEEDVVIATEFFELNECLAKAAP